ncbi:MAG: hypothetical protein ACE5JL_12775 [Dehalococcoidia bacterium]
MPHDHDMYPRQTPALEQTQEKKIQQWLEAMGHRLSCPICNSESLRSAGIVAPPLWQAEENTEGSNCPMLRLICTSCAHVILFDAQELGLA